MSEETKSLHSQKFSKLPVRKSSLAGLMQIFILSLNHLPHGNSSQPAAGAQPGCIHPPNTSYEDAVHPQTLDTCLSRRLGDLRSGLGGWSRVKGYRLLLGTKDFEVTSDGGGEKSGGVAAQASRSPERASNEPPRASEPKHHNTRLLLLFRLLMKQ